MNYNDLGLGIVQANKHAYKETDTLALFNQKYFTVFSFRTTVEINLVDCEMYFQE